MEIISRKDAIAKGLKHYFTGKPCKNGHIEQRHVSSKSCTLCVYNRNLAKFSTDTKLRESKREYSLRYNKVNKERLNKIKRDKYSSNPEYRKAENLRGKKYYRTPQGKLSKINGRNKYRALKINASTKCFNKIMTQEFYANCPDGYEVDHIIPLSKGGNHDISNLQYLTKTLNASKKDKHYTEINLPIFCTPCNPTL